MTYSRPVDGRRHYIVRIWDWSREVERMVCAENASEARWNALPRRGPGQYIIGVRRARQEEVDNATD